MASFKAGDRVRFSKAWCEPSEIGKVYIVIEAFDDVQRALIIPEETTLTIIPSEKVTYEMIEK